jgi:hypothetical protein
MHKPDNCAHIKGLTSASRQSHSIVRSTYTLCAKLPPCHYAQLSWSQARSIHTASTSPPIPHPHHIVLCKHYLKVLHTAELDHVLALGSSQCIALVLLCVFSICHCLHPSTCFIYVFPMGRLSITQLQCKSHATIKMVYILKAFLVHGSCKLHSPV